MLKATVLRVIGGPKKVVKTTSVTTKIFLDGVLESYSVELGHHLPEVVWMVRVVMEYSPNLSQDLRNLLFPSLEEAEEVKPGYVYY